jgi:transposase
VAKEEMKEGAARPVSALVGDRGYDGDGFRAEIVDRGAKPVVPNKSNRATLHSFSKRAYKGCNVIERCFCRLKDFRCVAACPDKLASKFLPPSTSPLSSPIGSIESEPQSNLLASPTQRTIS